MISTDLDSWSVTSISQSSLILQPSVTARQLGRSSSGVQSGILFVIDLPQQETLPHTDSKEAGGLPSKSDCIWSTKNRDHHRD